MAGTEGAECRELASEPSEPETTEDGTPGDATRPSADEGGPRRRYKLSLQDLLLQAWIHIKSSSLKRANIVTSVSYINLL